MLDGKTVLFLVSEDWYFLSHRLPVARALRAAGGSVLVASRINDSEAAIAAEGFEPIPLAIARSGRNPFADILLLINLIRLYRRKRPTVVHHVALKPILYGSIAAWIAGVPVVINAFAGLGFLFISQGAFARLVRPLVCIALRLLLNRKGSHTLVQNDDDARLMVDSIGVNANRLSIVRGSGVDVHRFQPSPEPEGVPIAVAATRLLWDKGLGELVEAARILRARGVALRIRLVGPSDENPAAIPAATLEAWRREGAVEIPGPSEDMAVTYAEAHIAVLPSYREGLPKALLEAAACGRPMVATDVPGCRDICRHESTGLLVPVHAVEPLADALQRLAKDAPLRRRLGAKARDLVASRFSEEVVAADTLALYARLLDLDRKR